MEEDVESANVESPAGAEKEPYTELVLVKEEVEVETFLVVAATVVVSGRHSGLTWMEGKKGPGGHKKEQLRHFHELAEKVGGCKAAPYGHVA